MKQSSTLRRNIVSYYWENKLLMSALLLVVAVSAISKTWIIFGDYYLVASVIDHEYDNFVILLITYLLTALCNFLAYSLQGYLVDLQIVNGSYRLESALINRLIKLDIKSYQASAHKTYLNLLLNNMAQINSNFNSQLNCIQSLIFTIGAIVLLSYINYWMLLIIIIGSAITALAYILSSWYNNHREPGILQHQEYLLRGLHNSLEEFTSFMLADRLSLYYRRVTRIIRESVRRIIRTRIQTITATGIYNIVYFGTNVASLIAVLTLWSYRLIPTALFVTSLNKLFQIKDNLINFFDTYKSLHQIRVIQHSWDRLFANKFNHTPHPAGELSTIELRDVSLSYASSEGVEEVLQDFNLKITRGQRVLIIGPSGSGKSSIAGLILNTVSPTGGSVLINDTVVAMQHSLGHLAAMCTNHMRIAPDTLDNIIASHSIGTQDLRRIEELREFCKIDFIDSDRSKIIDPATLSEGQIQRIALAQVLYQDRDLLIIDEALSNLDPNTRELLFNRILTLDKTIVYISHHLREEEIDRFDQVIRVTGDACSL